MLCRDASMPDGNQGSATLVDVMQEVIFMTSDVRNLLVGKLFVAWDGTESQYDIQVRWATESGEHPFEGSATLRGPTGVRTGRAILPVELPCPVSGWYVLQVQVAQSPWVRQLVEILQVPA